MKKYFRFLECLMLLICLALAGCSEEGDAIGTLDKSASNHVGFWTFSDKGYGTNPNDGQWLESKVDITPQRVVFERMPCRYFVEQIVPADLQNEALYNVLASDYSLKMTQVGQSDENIYLQLEQKDYSFKTQYSGEQHEIRLVMGDEGTAVGSLDYSRMSFVLSVERVLLDGVEVISYADGMLKLTFVYAP